MSGPDDDLDLEPLYLTDPGDDEDLESLEPLFLGGGATRSAAPVARKTMEVAGGREVNQKIHPDPHDLDYWDHEPVAMFTIVPVNQEWADQVVSGGPTRPETPGGAFSNIQTV